jgi:hypothetical protein
MTDQERLDVIRKYHNDACHNPEDMPFVLRLYDDAIKEIKDLKRRLPKDPMVAGILDGSIKYIDVKGEINDEDLDDIVI